MTNTSIDDLSTVAKDLERDFLALPAEQRAATRATYCDMLIAGQRMSRQMQTLRRTIAAARTTTAQTAPLPRSRRHDHDADRRLPAAR